MPSERDPIGAPVESIDLSPDGGWVEFADRLRALTGEVRVVVVRVPSDRSGRAASDDAAAPDQLEARAQALERLASPDVIFVAIAGGRCEGAGLAIALGCDLRLADAAAEFAFSSPELFGVLGRLAGAVGQTRALELCLTGRRMPAAEAAACGLVNLVVGGGQVVDAVDDLTAALLATPRELATELKRALLATSSGHLGATKISLSEELAAIVRLTGDDGGGREG